MCWVLDFEGYTLANAPPLKVGAVALMPCWVRAPASRVTGTERAGCQASAELALVLPMTAQVSMTCNHILQNHYPERLGLAVCYHAPMLFSLTWKVRWADGGVASDVGLAPHAAHLKHLCAMQR